MTKHNTPESWWQSVYPFAVQLEQRIINSPENYANEDVPQVIHILQDIGFNIEQQSYSDVVQPMREQLLRAIEYLILAYEEKLKGHYSEMEFHYSNGLMQIAQFHHNLVLHGFAN